MRWLKTSILLLLPTFLCFSALSLDPVRNFERSQTYLSPAPDGVDAFLAWSKTGGDGAGITVIDIEPGGAFDHIDSGSPSLVFGRNLVRNHGTSVFSILAARRDGQGITGIAHGAQLGLAAISSSWDGEEDLPIALPSIVEAIEAASARLQPGDVILMETHTDFGFGYLPSEFDDRVFGAVQRAVSRGIFVVQAAGNGGLNLDSPSMENKFDRRFRDSGAILVGSVSLQRRNVMSNYGDRIDAHADSSGVFAAFNGGRREVSGCPNWPQPSRCMYNPNFGGTSAASAIVAGAVASLSGIAKAQGRILRPEEIREALRQTGTQTIVPEGISRKPDLRQLIAYFGL